MSGQEIGTADVKVTPEPCSSASNFACWRNPFKYSTNPDHLVIHLETQDGVYCITMDTLNSSDEKLVRVFQAQLDVIREKKAAR